MAEVVFVGMNTKRNMRSGQTKGSWKWTTEYVRENNVFDNVIECRMIMLSEHTRNSMAVSRSDNVRGAVYDIRTGRLVGKMDGRNWYHYKNGQWYCARIKENGTIAGSYETPRLKAAPKNLYDLGIQIKRRR